MLTFFSAVSTPPFTARFTYPATVRTSNWPLHDIVIINIVRCMAHKREVEGGVYID